MAYTVFINQNSKNSSDHLCLTILTLCHFWAGVSSLSEAMARKPRQNRKNKAQRKLMGMDLRVSPELFSIGHYCYCSIYTVMTLGKCGETHA